MDPTRERRPLGAPTRTGEVLPIVAQPTDRTAQRLAERVAKVRRAREYRQQVRRVLERNRAAGKALRHAARLAAAEPVELHWTEVES